MHVVGSLPRWCSFFLSAVSRSLEWNCYRMPYKILLCKVVVGEVFWLDISISKDYSIFLYFSSLHHFQAANVKNCRTEKAGRPSNQERRR